MKLARELRSLHATNGHKEADSLLQIIFSEVPHLVRALRCKWAIEE